MNNTGQNQPKAGLEMDAILFGGAILLALVAFLYLSTQRQQQLRLSPTGFDGLVMWLKSEGRDAQSFTGGWTIDATSIGLNVLPVFDGKLDEARRLPENEEELLFQRDEVDLEVRVLRAKARMAPSLVVLPKWRSGVRLTGLAHPVLLIDADATTSVLHAIVGSKAGRIRHIPQPFSSFEYRPLEGAPLSAELYVAQVFDGNQCTPIIGRPRAMVLAECRLIKGTGSETVFVLSDPDLLNNHGMRLGDNARISADFFEVFSREGRVLVDYSRTNWLTEETVAVSRDRTWSDLRRFFGYPFSILWASAAVAMALLIWRAGLRFGPIPEADIAPSASKEAMNAARARLLRLTHEDGALLSEYVTARLSATATKLFGPAYLRHTPDETTLVRHAERVDPHLATDLESTLGRIKSAPSDLAAHDAIHFLDDLERILEQLTHDT